MHRHLVLAATAAVSAAIFVAPAPAAQLITRNARNVELRVDARGEALVTYRQGDTVRHVLAWGAVDAIAPKTSRSQVAFKVDYSGGYKKYGRPIRKSFRDVCGPYHGPRLAWFVKACTAPDGSHWALQSFRRMLGNYGVPTSGLRAAWELQLSHWRGELPVLEVKLDWADRRVDELYGRFTYRGSPVYGFRSDRSGRPLDSFGRLVFFDTFNSGYGPGWARHNSIVFHGPTGTFCEALYPGRVGYSPIGERYRVTANGPGVTPLVAWVGRSPGPFDAAVDRIANEELRALGDPACPPS